MPGREPRRRLDGRVGVAHLVVVFVAFLQALRMRDGLFDGRLLDRHLLQAPGERAILLDVLELFERRRADHAEIAGDQHRLDERGEIHRAASRRAGADGRVDLVDEEDRLGDASPSAPMTALKRSSKSPRKRVPASRRRAVERKDLRAFERRRHVGLEQS